MPRLQLDERDEVRKLWDDSMTRPFLMVVLLVVFALGFVFGQSVEFDDRD